jgi:hypothetical protein
MGLSDGDHAAVYSAANQSINDNPRALRPGGLPFSKVEGG